MPLRHPAPLNLGSVARLTRPPRTGPAGAAKPGAPPLPPLTACRTVHQPIASVAFVAGFMTASSERRLSADHAEAAAPSIKPGLIQRIEANRPWPGGPGERGIGMPPEETGATSVPPALLRPIIHCGVTSGLSVCRHALERLRIAPSGMRAPWLREPGILMVVVIRMQHRPDPFTSADVGRIRLGGCMEGKHARSRADTRCQRSTVNTDRSHRLAARQPTQTGICAPQDPSGRPGITLD